MTIEIKEGSAKITKRGVMVWVDNGHSMHSITISKSSWRVLKRETKKAHPRQVAFNQMVNSLSVLG